jgi:hypothetical protein
MVGPLPGLAHLDRRICAQKTELFSECHGEFNRFSFGQPRCIFYLKIACGWPCLEKAALQLS